MGKLADDNRPIQQHPGGQRCTVLALWSTLDDADQAVLEGWLNDPDVAHAAIARRLRHHDMPIAPGTVSRHRRHECFCRLDDTLTIYPEAADG